MTSEYLLKSNGIALIGENRFDRVWRTREEKDQCWSRRVSSLNRSFPEDETGEAWRASKRAKRSEMHSGSGKSKNWRRLREFGESRRESRES